MKTIILNGSPRKDWNTAQLLRAAQKGAESIGAETAYVELYDLRFTGCRSCMACKRRGIADPCRCYCRDELSPVLEQIRQADHLIMGSPIYFGEPTGQLRMALERIVFPALSYSSFSTIFTGKIDVDVFLTMNAPQEFYDRAYKEKMEEYFGPFHMLNGTIRIHPVCDTVQVKDYSLYEMEKIDGAHKQALHDAQFPALLEQAFAVGKRA